jgi:large subunit ribosomal protein L25
LVYVGTPLGATQGGKVFKKIRKLWVKGKVSDMPDDIEIDISELDLGDAKLIRDLEAPANTTFMDADRVAVVGIIKAK